MRSMPYPRRGNSHPKTTKKVLLFRELMAYSTYGKGNSSSQPPSKTSYSPKTYVPATIMNLMSTSHVSSDPNSAYLLYKYYIEAMMIPTCMDIIITMDHSGFHGSCQGFQVAVAQFTLPNRTSLCSNKKYIFIHRVHFPVFPS